MIHRFTVILYVVVAAAGVMIGFAEDKPAISVHIACPQEEVKSGSQIKLIVVATNLSHDDVDVYKAAVDGEAEDANAIEVRDESGKLMPRIDVRSFNTGGKIHTLPKKMRVNRVGVVLKPGEKLEDFAILSNLFDLSKPGRYTVTVQGERRSDDPNSGMTLIYDKSNVLNITVAK